MRRFFFALALIAACAFVVAALIGRDERSSNTLTVATSISPLADIIKEVGGEKVAVTTLVPTGTDPHDFEPRANDVVQVSRARIFFANGVGEEVYLDRLVSNAKSPNLKVIVLSDGLTILDKGRPGFGQIGNPHLWLSVENAIVYARRVRDALIEIDGSNRSFYEQRFADYKAELEELDRWIFRRIGEIPGENRKLVVFHNAFSYYARRYGLTVVDSVVTGSEEVEPSAERWRELIEKIKAERVKAVFGEKGFGRKVCSSLASDAGVAYVDALVGDTVGTDPASNTYVKMMRRNTELISGALK